MRLHGIRVMRAFLCAVYAATEDCAVNLAANDNVVPWGGWKRKRRSLAK